MGSPTQWHPLAVLFGGGTRVWMERMFPMDFVVNTALTSRVPTTDDPLGSIAQFELQWRDPQGPNWAMEQPEFRVRYRGSVSPWLPPVALMSWLMIEWPDAFRRL